MRVCVGDLVALAESAFDRGTAEQIAMACGAGSPQGLEGVWVDLSPIETCEVGRVFAKALDSRSVYTHNHARSVARRSRALAYHCEMGDEVASRLYLAGALHDIGKLRVPSMVLNKPGRLTDIERVQVQRHAMWTWDMVGSVAGLEDVRRWAGYHHERLDGSGYPFGLTAPDLDEPSRIVACADVYSALTELRSYRVTSTPEQALETMRDQAREGKLDARLVEDVAELVRTDKYEA